MNTNSCNNLSNEPVIIIGAGWSGLACAVTLIQQGYKVRLLESARHAGGRARSVSFDGLFSNQAVDNGQHIMLGAYHYTRELFKSLGLDEATIFEQHPLELKMYSPEQTNVHLKSLPLPAPLHLVLALFNLDGINLVERYKAVKMVLKLALSGYKLQQDICVSDLLIRHQQSQKVISALWEPLCLATMNTPIQYASAQVFLNVLKDSFSRKRRDSDLLFFKFDLSRIFSTPAMQYILHNDCQVLCSNKVTDVQIVTSGQNNSTIHFKVTTIHGTHQGQRLVLATPAHITNKLLHSASNQSCLQTTSFLTPPSACLQYSYEPICTVYMQYPAGIRLPDRMIGLFNTIGQWAIDRSCTQQPGLIAVVISGPGKHLRMAPAQLVDTLHNELSIIITDLPAMIHYKIITEKRATFSCRVNIEHQRPSNTTSVPGLYLAGDYTDTGYPATLEGAIKSGVMAARHIVNNTSSFTR